MKVLASQDGLIELCYTRAVDTIQRCSASGSRGNERARAIRSSVELVFALSSSRAQSNDEKAKTIFKLMKEINEKSALGEEGYTDGNFIQEVLNHLRKGISSAAPFGTVVTHLNPHFDDRATHCYIRLPFLPFTRHAP